LENSYRRFERSHYLDLVREAVPEEMHDHEDESNAMFLNVAKYLPVDTA